MKRKTVMMIGTHPEGKGGIASVVKGYMDAGLMDRLGIDYYSDHKGGSKLFEALYYLGSFLRIIASMPRHGILHVHTSHYWSFRRLFTIILIGRLLRRKIIIHVHGSKFDVYYKESSFLEKLIIRFGFDISDKIIALSKEWKAKLSEITDSEKILVIYNSVQLPEFPNFGQKLDSKHVLFLGLMGQRKGVYDLVRALRIIRDKGLKVKAFICGNGEIDTVKKQVSQLGLNDMVSVPGWVTGDERLKLLQTAYCYALPSYHEGLPMSILEAMAYGTPVISTPVGGIPEAVKDGYNGFLVPPGSPEAIAEKLELILTDSKLWEKLARNAYDTIKNNFNITQVEDRLSHLYQELMGE